MIKLYKVVMNYNYISSISQNGYVNNLTYIFDNSNVKEMYASSMSNNFVSLIDISISHLYKKSQIIIFR